MFALVSGRSAPLWLPAAKEHAGEDTHAGPEGGHTGDSLRELQGWVHSQDDSDGGAREETEVRGARGCSNDQDVHMSKWTLELVVFAIILVCWRGATM